MKIIKLIYAIILIGFTACERPADLNKITNYSTNGVEFSIPGNWEVTEDVAEKNYRYIFIETPGDAIVSIMFYPIEENLTLDEFVDWSISIIKEKMPGIIKYEDNSKKESIVKTINNKKIKGICYKFNISILGDDLPHTSEYFLFKNEKEVAYISTQVADEDLSMVKKGFDLVITTFTFSNALTIASKWTAK